MYSCAFVGLNCQIVYLVEEVVADTFAEVKTIVMEKRKVAADSILEDYSEDEDIIVRFLYNKKVFDLVFTIEKK